MNRLGKVLHLSKNKNLVLRAKDKVKTNTPVLDEELRKVGVVFEVFGPVDNPYVSVKPTTNNPGQYVGRFLYTLNPEET